MSATGGFVATINQPEGESVRSHDVGAKPRWRAVVRGFALLFAFVLLLSFPLAAPGPAAPAACRERFSIRQEGTTQDLLYCSNRDIDETNPAVRRAIIVVHGTNRNADEYFQYMVQAAQGARSADSLIVAPWFTTESDVDDSDVLHWTSEGWKQGDRSTSDVEVSSFAVVDQLITHIAQHSPSLRSVIVTGHSAGGQFAQRYAAGSRIVQQFNGKGIRFGFIVANPSSYLQLTSERPPGANDDGSSSPDRDSCPDYDTYKYGLRDLNEYMAQVGRDEIRSQYKERSVVYLLGDRDRDTNDSDLDRSCGAELQGRFRLERGINYYNSLRRVYGPSIYTRHSLAMVPGVAHDGNAMYNSSAARGFLFGSEWPPSPTPRQPRSKLILGAIILAVLALLAALAILVRRVSRRGGVLPHRRRQSLSR